MQHIRLMTKFREKIQFLIANSNGDLKTFFIKMINIFSIIKMGKKKKLLLVLKFVVFTFIKKSSMY